MIDSFVLLTPILMLPVVALLVFVGCDWVFGLDRQEPIVPVLTATPGNAKVELSWGADPGRAHKFHVKRGEISGVHEFVGEVMGSGNTYPDNNVTNGTTYFYVVTAFGEEGETDPSNEEMATPSDVILTAFVTPETTLGSLVPSAAGLFGMAIQVGPNPLTIKTLGRAFAPGNSQIHIIKIVEVVDATTKTDVPNAFVAVSMAGGSVGQFNYAPLANSITLDADASYYIVSQEAAGGDQFYNHDTTIETTDVAVVTSSVRGTGTSYLEDAPGAKAYGPVNFQY